MTSPVNSPIDITHEAVKILEAYLQLDELDGLKHHTTTDVMMTVPEPSTQQATAATVSRALTSNSSTEWRLSPWLEDCSVDVCCTVDRTKKTASCGSVDRPSSLFAKNASFSLSARGARAVFYSPVLENSDLVGNRQTSCLNNDEHNDSDSENGNS